MKKEETTKKKTEENQWIWWIILILVILGVLWFFGFFDGNDDYSYCVDNCVADMGLCTSGSFVFDKDGEGYIPESDYNSCYDDLEYCVSNCNP